MLVIKYCEKGILRDHIALLLIGWVQRCRLVCQLLANSLLCELSNEVWQRRLEVRVDVFALDYLGSGLDFGHMVTHVFGHRCQAVGQVKSQGWLGTHKRRGLTTIDALLEVFHRSFQFRLVYESFR